MAGNKRWSQNDIDALKAEYGLVDVEILAKKLNRSVDAVHWKASNLEIKYDPTSVIGINKRLDGIEKLLKEVVDLLQTTLHTSSKWAKKEVKQLEQMYAEGKSLDEISQTLGRAKTTLYNKLSECNFKRLNQKGTLSAENKEFIDKNYLSMTYGDIAKQLNIGKSTISNYVAKQKFLGLLKGKHKEK